MRSKLQKKEEVSIVIRGRSRVEKVIFPIVFVIFLLYAISLIYPFVWLFPTTSRRLKCSIWKTPRFSI